MTHVLFLLGGVLGALVVAFVYITVAANAEANHQDRVMSVPSIEPDLDAFLRALRGATGSGVVAGNEVEMFQNGDEIFPPMLAAIRDSRSTIHFSTYIYWAGEVPRQFARKSPPPPGAASRCGSSSTAKGPSRCPATWWRRCGPPAARSPGSAGCNGSTG